MSLSRFFFRYGLFSSLIVSCSTPVPGKFGESPIHDATSGIEVLAKKNLGPFPSLVAGSSDGVWLLYSRSLDSNEIQGSEKRTRVYLMDSKLKIFWEQDLKSTVLGMDVTRDGSHSIISTQDGIVMAVDPKGILLWKKEAKCIPKIMSDSIFCAGLWGTTWKVVRMSLSGVVLNESALPLPIQKIIPHRDGHQLLLVMREGYIRALDPTSLKVLWKNKCGQEVHDAFFLELEGESLLGLLYQDQKHRVLELLDSVGKKSRGFIKSQVWISGQVAYLGSDSQFVLYANHPKGQFLNRIQIKKSTGQRKLELFEMPTEHWRPFLPYASGAIQFQDTVLIARGGPPLEIIRFARDHWERIYSAETASSLLFFGATTQGPGKESHMVFVDNLGELVSAILNR